jgi:hypothetical protein
MGVSVIVIVGEGVAVAVFVGVAVGGIGVAVGGAGVAVGRSGALIVGTSVAVGLVLPQAAVRLRMIIVAATIL